MCDRGARAIRIIMKRRQGPDMYQASRHIFRLNDVVHGAAVSVAMPTGIIVSIASPRRAVANAGSRALRSLRSERRGASHLARPFGAGVGKARPWPRVTSSD